MSKTNKYNTYLPYGNRNSKPSGNAYVPHGKAKPEVADGPYRNPTVEEVEEILLFKQGRLEKKDENRKYGLLMVGWAPNVDEDPTNPWVDSSVWAFVNGYLLCVVRGISRPMEYTVSSVKISDDLMTITTDTGNSSIASIKEVGFTFNGETIASDKQIGFFLNSEGFVVRLARFRGMDWFVTRGKIDGTVSRWGSLKMIDAYNQAGGHSFEQLFGKSHSCPYVYTFTITCQSSVTGTRQVLSNPNSSYITLIASYMSWSDQILSPWTGQIINPFLTDDPNPMDYIGPTPERCYTILYDHSQQPPNIENPAHCIKVYSYSDFPGKVDGPLGVIMPVSIAPSEVNEFLNWGFYETLTKIGTHDPRVQPGESVVFSANGYLGRLTHISFEWRNRLRRVPENGQNNGGGGEPKIIAPFWRSIVGNFKNQQEYDTWFLPIETMTTKALFKFVDQKNPLVYVNYADTSGIYEKLKNDTNGRRKAAFTNFILSVPPHLQPEAFSLWLNSGNQLEKLRMFIEGYQKKLFYFLDTSEGSQVLERLGTSEENRLEAERQGNMVVRGKAFFYRVKDPEKFYKTIPNGKYYVVGVEAHPQVTNIAQSATRYAEKKSREAVGDAKRNYAYWNKTAINRMIDYVYNPDHVKQMVEQLEMVEPKFFEDWKAKTQ